MVTMSDPIDALRAEARAAMSIRMGGVAEISAMLGTPERPVPRSTISMWDSRRVTTGFPEPILRLAAGPIYDLDAVQAWWNSREVKA